MHIGKGLRKRRKGFAVRVVRFVELTYPKSKASDVMAYRLLKVASSVAANYRAASRARSNPGYLDKVQTALQ